MSGIDLHIEYLFTPSETTMQPAITQRPASWAFAKDIIDFREISRFSGKN
jgi:hypothetical protein